VGGHPYFFARSIPLIEATIWSRRGQLIGGMRKRGSAERFDTLLRGEPAIDGCARFLLGTHRGERRVGRPTRPRSISGITTRTFRCGSHSEPTGAFPQLERRASKMRTGPNLDRWDDPVSARARLKFNR
jgi:hypothetical protein